MPASTTTHAIPYPLPTDKVSDYPALSKSAAEAIDSKMGLSPLTGYSPRGGNPPADKPLRVIGWTSAGTTNQYGQIVITPPPTVAGWHTLVATVARFDSEDSAAFSWSVAITGKTADGALIVTITSGGTRVANKAVFVSVMGLGW